MIYFISLNSLKSVSNFADETTFFACEKDLKTLISRLEHDSHLTIEWFERNYMKVNLEKCHLLVSGINMKIFGHKLLG